MSGKRLLLLVALCGLWAGCQTIAPGAQTRKDQTATIHTFVDANRDGKRNRGESALPDILIAARSNIHGGMTYTAQLTDDNGETRITATYTHYFDLIAFVPCGYEATTPTAVKAKRTNEFGFAPVAPQPSGRQSGIADFYLILWHDENQDGVYQSGEVPLAGELLYLDPGLPWTYAPDIATGQLRTQTDSGGEAVANLGNSCGEVTVTIPERWRPSTRTGEGLWEEGKYRVAYQPGRTNIFLAVVPQE